ncbi:TorF family putative porin [Acinetobacter kyonggiensis]|nr:TorF family putative porin [Acinetobacter kyonggiensis]
MSTFAEEKTTLAIARQLTSRFAVVNQYIYRGGVENDDVALQTGIKYAHHNGVAVGY